MAGRPYGSRARIGLIVPSSNTVAETECWRLAPEGVTVHTTRMLFDTRQPDPLSAMEDHLPHALEEVRSADVTVIAYGCTASALRTPPENTLSEIESATALPAVTTMGAVLEAFERFGARRIAVGSPYPETVNAAERAFLEARGYVVTADEAAIVGEEQRNLRGMCKVPSDRVAKLARDINSADCDLIFLSCSDMATLEVIGSLEEELGKPVVSSVQATMWAALRRVGLGDRIDGAGRLLRDF